MPARTARTRWCTFAGTRTPNSISELSTGASVFALAMWMPLSKLGPPEALCIARTWLTLASANCRR
eukprot:9538649-Alexandrium_andersonii.AAC.1